jgi:hypothetical protein
MLVKWAIGGIVFMMLFMMFGFGMDFFFTDLGDSLMYCVVVGGPLGIVVRKWIFRTFWM